MPVLAPDPRSAVWYSRILLCICGGRQLAWPSRRVSWFGYGCGDPNGLGCIDQAFELSTEICASWPGLSSARTHGRAQDVPGSHGRPVEPPRCLRLCCPPRPQSRDAPRAGAGARSRPGCKRRLKFRHHPRPMLLPAAQPADLPGVAKKLPTSIVGRKKQRSARAMADGAGDSSDPGQAYRRRICEPLGHEACRAVARNPASTTPSRSLPATRATFCTSCRRCRVDTSMFRRVHPSPLRTKPTAGAWQCHGAHQREARNAAGDGAELAKISNAP